MYKKILRVKTISFKLAIVQNILQKYLKSEFEKHRIVEDRLFESNVDRLLKETEEGGEGRE